MRYRTSSAPLFIRSIKSFLQDLWSFCDFLFYYLKKKVTKSFLGFEKEKNILVKFFMMKRGRYTRPFLHFATLGVLATGIGIGPFLSETFPLFAQETSIAKVASPAAKQQVLGTEDNVFQTNVSDNHRTAIINYNVQHGDTLSTIAQKFGISTDTIKWANNLSDDSISSGDQLQIPPVSGVIHKVKAGETIYSIAKLYNANPQSIADFPSNDFANPETLSLVVGETLIVPEGQMPTAQTTPKPQPSYIAGAPEGGSSAPYSGGFIWPTHGELSQGFTFYHPGFDIAGPIGTPIYAAMSGTVVDASCGWNYGYGCTVLIKHPNGFATRYAHMNGQPYVSVGQSVSGGQQIGIRGTTGRSTGPHLHFEIHNAAGIAVNPGSYLP
ncbi:MAG TPA: M23 family metallopeptidase [Candidatus Saccharimonadales bacterium]|nr:M23 family metallopeptidase [Candidatus Saccharimonadales bacterium]